MKFNLLCISYHLLIVTNLVNAKLIYENLVVALPTQDPEPVRGKGKEQTAEILDESSSIFSDAGVLNCITSRICVSSTDTIDKSLLENDSVMVENDKMLVTKASPSNANEVTSWGVTEVLEDITFWDNLSPPSGETIKVCVVGSGYDLSHPDLPSEPDVIGVDSSHTDEAWGVDSLGPGTHSAGTIAAIGNNDIGVSEIKYSRCNWLLLTLDVNTGQRYYSE